MILKMFRHNRRIGIFSVFFRFVIKGHDFWCVNTFVFASLGELVLFLMKHDGFFLVNQMIYLNFNTMSETIFLELPNWKSSCSVKLNEHSLIMVTWLLKYMLRMNISDLARKWIVFVSFNILKFSKLKISKPDTPWSILIYNLYWKLIWSRLIKEYLVIIFPLVATVS